MSTELLERMDLNRRSELARLVPSCPNAIFVKLERKGITTPAQLLAARDADLLHDLAGAAIDANQLAALRAAVTEEAG